MFLDFLLGKTSFRSRVRRRDDAANLSVPAPRAEVAKAAPAPGTSISYRPDLIPKLKDDHEQLRGILEAIEMAFEAGNVALTVLKLNQFRTMIQSHLLAENVSLYVYLRRSLAGDERNHALVQGFQREMDEIGRSALEFVAKYSDLGRPGHQGLTVSFAKDLANVGEVLGKRVAREEVTLYPLYRPVR